MQAVGYDTNASTPYFKVRNSWGSGWGEAGFVRIGYTASGKGICGILEDPSWVTTKSA